jgi:hypothetical protein
LILIILALTTNCDKSAIRKEEEKEIREASIIFCKRFLVHPELPERVRFLARLVIQERENNSLDPEPILIRALLARPDRMEIITLALAVSDEDGDLAGIGVREQRIGSSGKSIIIEEEYPVFGYQSLRIATFQIITVAIRKDNERKNEELWQKYLDTGVWKRDAIPPVWVSVPVPGKTDVEVWLYDNAGHKSEAISLGNSLIDMH